MADNWYCIHVRTMAIFLKLNFTLLGDKLYIIEEKKKCEN